MGRLTKVLLCPACMGGGKRGDPLDKWGPSLAVSMLMCARLILPLLCAASLSCVSELPSEAASVATGTDAARPDGTPGDQREGEPEAGRDSARDASLPPLMDATLDVARDAGPDVALRADPDAQPVVDPPPCQEGLCAICVNGEVQAPPDDPRCPLPTCEGMTRYTLDDGGEDTHCVEQRFDWIGHRCAALGTCVEVPTPEQCAPRPPRVVETAGPCERLDECGPDAQPSFLPQGTPCPDGVCDGTWRCVPPMQGCEGRDAHVCESDDESCVVQLEGDQRCDDYCEARGGECDEAHERGRGPCSWGREVDCNRREGVILCTCSFDDDDDDG